MGYTRTRRGRAQAEKGCVEAARRRRAGGTGLEGVRPQGRARVDGVSQSREAHRRFSFRWSQGSRGRRHPHGSEIRSYDFEERRGISAKLYTTSFRPNKMTV
eukprot:1922420-Prymnesium_polylepis.2